MCQFICCDCWWVNAFGACAGVHYAYLFCSCWLCQPQQMLNIDPNCCKFGEMTGIGSNFFCCGHVMCIPRSLRSYSDALQSGSKPLTADYTSQPTYNQPPFHQGYSNQAYNNQGYNNQGYNNQGYKTQGYQNQGYSNQPNQTSY